MHAMCIRRERSQKAQQMIATMRQDDLNVGQVNRSNLSRVAKARESPTSTSSRDRSVVDHTYHDHIHDPPEDFPCTVGYSDAKEGRKKGPRGGVTITFPEKLHIMLQACCDEGLEHVVSWLPHGRCFLVHQKTEFVEKIMPRFFHQTKMTSFQRQLNLYGFVRLTAGKDRGAYYHELFLRGRAWLARNMSRTRVKGNGMKAASSPQTEPNFYNMEPCLELDSSKASLLQANDARFAREDNPIFLEESDAYSEDDSMDLCETTAPITSSALEVEPVPPTPFNARSLSSESLIPPAIVSLPSSPQSDCRSISVEWPDTILFTNVSSLDLFDEQQWRDEPDAPSSGDEVFFEGSRFHYLDRDDVGIEI